jgi:site-specific DNA-methyltransferase (adenine-specific)
MIELLNIDCIAYMKTCQDNEFDLAICDPPYGIGKDGTIGFATEKTKGFTFTQKEYKQKDWDKTTPPQEYFDELKRVSKNQIIWGANYFPYLWQNRCKGFVFWNKDFILDFMVLKYPFIFVIKVLSLLSFSGLYSIF